MARGGTRPASGVVAIARELLKKHEGIRSKPYVCTAGKISVGIGRNLEDRGLSLDEIEFLFANDLVIVARDCIKLFRDFNSITPAHRQAALIDMCFNLGGPRLTKFVKMRAAVDLRDWKTVAKEALDSKWAKDVGQRAVTICYILEHGKMPGG